MSKKSKSKGRIRYKDPLRNSKQKFEKIKDKINKAPKDSDVQEIPRAYQFFQSSLGIRKSEKNKAKELRKKRKKVILSQHKTMKGLNIGKEKNKQNQLKKRINLNKNDNLIDTADFMEKNIGWYPHNGKPFKPIPTLKQFPNESFYSFQRRVSAATNAVIHESKFRDKYNVDVVRNETGEVVQVVKNRDGKSQTSRQKKRLKDKEKKLELKKNKTKVINNLENPDPEEDDIDAVGRKLFRKEKVEFGDIVHRPPSLNTDKLDKLLKSKKDEKNSLFLQTLRKETEINQHKKPSRIRKEAERDLEAERVAAVQAYRQLKLTKKKLNIEMGMIV